MSRWSVLTLTWHSYLQVYSSFIESIMLCMVLICWELMICAPVNSILPMTTLFHILLCVWDSLVIFYLVASRWCRLNSFWVWFGIHMSNTRFSLLLPWNLMTGKFGGQWINVYEVIDPDCILRCEAVTWELRCSHCWFIAHPCGEEMDMCIVWMTSVGFLRSLLLLTACWNKRITMLLSNVSLFLLLKLSQSTPKVVWIDKSLNALWLTALVSVDQRVMSSKL